MNPALKRLTDESKAAFLKHLAEQGFMDMVASTKAGLPADLGTFKFIVSTEDRDRQGEIVKQDGWDLTFYKLNPVVLWGHDYQSMPIGVCTLIQVINNELVAEGTFAPHTFAQDVRKLYDLGMVRTTSVGFIPREFDPNNDEIITKAELLEFSIVPVPANPYALTQRQVKELKLDVPMLETKGMKFEVKEVQPGARCTGDDGTQGVLGKDPKNPDGPMICVPSKGMTMKDAEEVMNNAIDAHKGMHDPAHAAHHGFHTAAIDTFKAMMKSESNIDLDTCPCFSDLINKVALENQRHSKDVSSHTETVHAALGSYRKLVTAVMALYPDSPETGDDAGANPTANEVRMIQTIKTAFEHLSNAATALKDIAESEGGKKEAPAPTAPITPAKKDDGIVDVKTFLENRAFLKDLNIVIGKALRDFNRLDIAKKR